MVGGADEELVVVEARAWSKIVSPLRYIRWTWPSIRPGRMVASGYSRTAGAGAGGDLRRRPGGDDAVVLDEDGPAAIGSPPGAPSGAQVIRVAQRR